VLRTIKFHTSKVATIKFVSNRQIILHTAWYSAITDVDRIVEILLLSVHRNALHMLSYSVRRPISVLTFCSRSYLFGLTIGFPMYFQLARIGVIATRTDDNNFSTLDINESVLLFCAMCSVILSTDELIFAVVDVRFDRL
jgi:hypothetical protein